MLAYVFWHWRYPHIEKLSYQQLLIDFHTALRAQKPVGFDYSTVFQVEHVPWLSMAGEAYEEWYILENSAALDALNEAAITGLCREPHQSSSTIRCRWDRRIVPIACLLRDNDSTCRIVVRQACGHELRNPLPNAPTTDQTITRNPLGTPDGTRARP